jgi:hypothetical protein
MRKAGWTVAEDAARNKEGVIRWTITPPTEKAGNSSLPSPPDPPAGMAGMAGVRSEPSTYETDDLDAYEAAYPELFGVEQ